MQVADRYWKEIPRQFSYYNLLLPWRTYMQFLFRAAKFVKNDGQHSKLYD